MMQDGPGKTAKKKRKYVRRKPVPEKDEALEAVRAIVTRLRPFSGRERDRILSTVCTFMAMDE